MAPYHLAYHRRPSVVANHVRAFYPSRLRPAGEYPQLRATWTGHRAGGNVLAQLCRLTRAAPSKVLPLLYPHVVGFPLQMAILTHPSCPVAIWRIVQVRNHLLQRRPIEAGTTLDFETTVDGQRVLENGREVDLRTVVRARDELAWESINTFRWRGRTDSAGEPSALATAPAAGGDIVAEWQPGNAGWRFALIAGDLNGIHWSNRYARLFGFRRALHYPQVILGECLARLGTLRDTDTQRLDAWLKGPVYKGARICLRARRDGDGTVFAVLSDDSRPAILARWGAEHANAGLP